jgi:hypothetical protein
MLELPPPELDFTSAVAIRGETRNVSDGGLCVRLDQPCHPAALLRCEISVNGGPPAIPTLTYVRWVREDPSAYLAGLEFLLHT